MPQCKAETADEKQCSSPIAAPSRSLCKRHQSGLATGKPVFSFETGRKFPARAITGAATIEAPGRPRQQTSGPATRRAPDAPATSEYNRVLGEHPLICDAPRCGQPALPATNYCTRHQGRA